jgi:membrane carboxypeptidase/penicillin-binding protein PbpC
VKKILIEILAGTVAIIALAACYLLIVVVKAKLDTPKIVADALGRCSGKLGVRDLSKWQLDALLKIEDPGFYSHNGVDLTTPGAGITTITQGLVKIYYYHPFKSGPINKLTQTLITLFAFNPYTSKEEQLRLFINDIYLGKIGERRIYGFGEAADAYFKKTISALTEDEFLSLVAMIIAPANFSIVERPAANKERTARIKKVVSGEYKPKSLMDLYYGPLDPESQENLPPVSYFPGIYSNKDGK